MSQQSNTSKGLGFTTVLFLVFLILKLTETIDWSWWWVFAPFWIPFAILLLALMLIGLIEVINRE